MKNEYIFIIIPIIIIAKRMYFISIALILLNIHVTPFIIYKNLFNGFILKIINPKKINNGDSENNIFIVFFTVYFFPSINVLNVFKLIITF